MGREIFLETPPGFSFRHTVYSHGWSELLPFRLDADTWRLTYVFPTKTKPVSAVVTSSGSVLKIDVAGGRFDEEKLVREVRHILRLDEPLDEFYELTNLDERLRWVAPSNAGRLLRSPTVFEDLVKTLCTTNCSWSLTRIMTRNLVEKLGKPAVGGGHTFPTAEALTSVDEKFYRDEIKAGYRSPYFVELAAAVASGELDPESWLTTDMPTSELKKEIKGLKGFGDYAADNLLKLLGRYDGLALDSWLRSQFYKKHNRDRTCADKKIERHYKKYGSWRGLAIWCDMTERWFDEKLLNAPDAA
jgi:3-methyladenine DNA glycosylase/8-oxoguanine DNA glycosylase